MKTIWFTAITSIILIFVFSAVAESPKHKSKNDRIQLETVVVEAKFFEELPISETVSSSVEELTKENIPDRIFSIEEVLDSLVGVNVRSTGGMGARKDVSIRGATTRQLSVYLDGVPAGASASGITGLSSIPVGQINKIQVFRGSAPIYFGAGAIGGVINIETLPDSFKNQTTISLSYGSYETNHQQISSRFSLKEKHSVSISAGRRSSKNNFEYFDNKLTVNTADDEYRTRENSDYSAWEFLTGWKYKLNQDHSLLSNLTFSGSEKGIPGSGTNLNYHSRFSKEQILFQTKYDFRKEFELHVWVNQQDRLFEDPKGEVRTVYAKKTISDINTIGILSRLKRYHNAETWYVTTEVKQEDFEAYDELDPDTIKLPSKRYHISTGLEAELPFFDEKLWFQPGVHHVYVSDKLIKTNLLGTAEPESFKKDYNVTTFTTGLRYHFTDSWMFKSNAGFYYRLPGFNELYGNSGNLVGNPEIEEEKSRNADMGLRYSSVNRKHSSELVVFYRDVKDMILMRSYGDYSRYENIGKAQITGIEFLTSGKFFDDSLLYGFSFSFQDALNKSDATLFRKTRYYGKKLPYHPALETSAQLTWHITDILGIKAEITAESESYRGPSNLGDQRIDGKTICALQLILKPYEKLKVTIDIDNCGDEQAVDRWGYPLPGRSYYVNMNYRF